MDRDTRVRWLVLLFSFFIAGGYLFNWISVYFLHERGANKEGFVELTEAIIWLTSAILFAVLWLRTQKAPTALVTLRRWFGLFALLCLFAAGEEVSWGQHLQLVSPGETMETYNAQRETNLHNLNINQILGLREDGPLAPYLTNANKLFNPAAYLGFTLLWVVLPVLVRSGRAVRLPILGEVLVPPLSVTVFFALNVLGYIVIDRLLWDVAEFFEFSMGAATLVVAYAYVRQQQRFALHQESARSHSLAGRFARLHGFDPRLTTKARSLPAAEHHG